MTRGENVGQEMESVKIAKVGNIIRLKIFTARLKSRIMADIGKDISIAGWVYKLGYHHH